MAVGPRPDGTDGSDFFHRERVATHYKQSAELKPKLSRVLKLQFLCGLLCLVMGLAVAYDYPSLLCVIGYVIGLPLAHLALRSNSYTYINLYGCCCSMLGVFPMVYTLYTSLWMGALTSYWYQRLGLAVAVIVVNTMGMYIAKNLMTTWSAARPQAKRR